MKPISGDMLLKQLERHTSKCTGLVQDGTRIFCEKCGLAIYQGESPTIETKGVLIEVS